MLVKLTTWDGRGPPKHLAQKIMMVIMHENILH